MTERPDETPRSTSGEVGGLSSRLGRVRLPHGVLELMIGDLRMMIEIKCRLHVFSITNRKSAIGNVNGKCGRRRRGARLLSGMTWVRLPPLPLIARAAPGEHSLAGLRERRFGVPRSTSGEVDGLSSRPSGFESRAGYWFVVRPWCSSNTPLFQSGFAGATPAGCTVGSRSIYERAHDVAVAYCLAMADVWVRLPLGALEKQ